MFLRDYAAILREAGIEPPPGEIIMARYIMGSSDWYAEMEDGWYWWSGKEWKPCPNGPLYY